MRGIGWTPTLSQLDAPTCESLDCETVPAAGEWVTIDMPIGSPLSSIVVDGPAGVCGPFELLIGACVDRDGDFACDNLDPCTGPDSDGDVACDAVDLCQGYDPGGDADGDGICDVQFTCPCGPGAMCGDADADGLCAPLDACFGEDSTGDFDGDGVCNDRDLCLGDDATGDDDGDGGYCDDLDPCEGDDATGDADGDGRCADTDVNLSVSDLRPGQPVTLRATELQPFGQVRFLLATSLHPPARGPTCFGPSGDGCTRLKRPRVSGPLTADASGEAELTFVAPASLVPGTDVYIEAIEVICPAPCHADTSGHDRVEVLP